MLMALTSKEKALVQQAYAKCITPSLGHFILSTFMLVLSLQSQSDCSLAVALPTQTAGSGRKALSMLFNKHPLTYHCHCQRRSPTVNEILKGQL